MYVLIFGCFSIFVCYYRYAWSPSGFASSLDPDIKTICSYGTGFYKHVARARKIGTQVQPHLERFETPGIYRDRTVVVTECRLWSPSSSAEYHRMMLA